MPLQVVSRALGLPDPVVRVAEPMWIFAETINLLGTTGLLVYRSTALSDDDEEYAHVADLLRRSRYEILHKSTIPDDGMMFGEAEWAMYLLHSTTNESDQPTDPRVHQVLKLIEAWNDPVHPTWAPAEIRKRLELVGSGTTREDYEGAL